MNDGTTEVWRIVEIKAGIPHTLFHGNANWRLGYSGLSGRTRKLRFRAWMQAERKLVKDGSGQEPYEAGFNVLLSREKAVEYMKRFTAPRDLRIARCQAQGLRQKPTNQDVWLADHLWIDEIELKS